MVTHTMHFAHKQILHIDLALSEVKKRKKIQFKIIFYFIIKLFLINVMLELFDISVL